MKWTVVESHQSLEPLASTSQVSYIVCVCCFNLTIMLVSAELTHAPHRLLCGALYSENEEHFTFVLTDLDSNYRFGFCFYRPKADTCMCFIRYIYSTAVNIHTHAEF